MQTVGTYEPDILVIADPKTDIGTLAVGRNLSRGAVLGKIGRSLGAVDTSGLSGGGGAMTGVTLGRNAKIGDYTVTCIAEAENGGTFKVVDPDGERLDDAVVGEAYVSNHVGFTINDGDPDFEAGDVFVIPVAAGSGEYTLVDKTAVDGSAVADAVLAEDLDASEEAGDIIIYTAGTFNQNALSFADGTEAVDVVSDLRMRNIYLKEGRPLSA